MENRRNQERTNQKRIQSRAEYVYGNAVRKVDIQRRIEEPKKELSVATRKNRDKAKHMNLGYVAFLMGALVIAGVILIDYIQLQTAITNKVEYIAKQERTLNSLRIANDEEYSRLVSNIDLEEVKRIAIGELGMVYPTQGQIITFTNEGYDYVRKVTDSN